MLEGCNEVEASPLPIAPIRAESGLPMVSMKSSFATTPDMTPCRDVSVVQINMVFCTLPDHNQTVESQLQLVA